MNLILGVELIRPGILSSFIFENQSTSEFSHDEHVTEWVAVGVEIILDLVRLPAVEYLPGVGLGGLEGVAKVSQHGNQQL